MARSAQNNAWQRFLAKPPQLEGGANLAVRPMNGRRAQLRLDHQGHALELVAAWLAVPYPSGLRRLLAAESDIDGVVIERIPSGFDAAARELGVSYLDVRGRGRVVGPGFVYVAPGIPVPQLAWRGDDLPGQQSPGMSSPPQSPGRARPRVSPFAPKASRIVRALLVDPQRRWRLSELSREVEVDPGNAHRVLNALVDAGFVERDGDLYVTVDPGSLLEAWAESYRQPKDRIRLPVVQNVDAEVREVLAEIGENAVVSGELAAELVAPHLPARSALVHCLGSDAWQQIVELRERQVPHPRPSGQIIVDLPDPGVAHFARQNGLPLASPVQVYVDLARERGRGREAAEHLRREVLGY